MKSQDSEDESQPGGLDERLYRATFHETVYNGQPISWRYWVEQMPALSAAQATRLLAGLDPDIFADLSARPNQNDPAGPCSRAASMERLANAEGNGAISPRDWLAWATQHEFQVHEGFRLAVEATRAYPSNVSASKKVSGAGDPCKTGAVLSTDEVIEAFRGVGMDGLAWGQMLNKNRPHWLLECRKETGGPGAKATQSTWWPLAIARALVTGQSRKAGSVSASQLDRAFNQRPELRPLGAAWASLKADNPAWGD